MKAEEVEVELGFEKELELKKMKEFSWLQEEQEEILLSPLEWN